MDYEITIGFVGIVVTVVWAWVLSGPHGGDAYIKWSEFLSGDYKRE